MIQPVYVIKSFDLRAALTLILVTFTLATRSDLSERSPGKNYIKANEKTDYQNHSCTSRFIKDVAQAVETAINLAKRFGATVHLAHIEPYYPVGLGSCPRRCRP